MKEYDLYIENSYGNKKIATFYCDCDLLAYIRTFNPPEKHNYFIIEREVEEQRISVESFKGICNWKEKRDKCK